MVNRPAMKALSLFISEPTTLNASCLVGIPCIYEVLQYHEFHQQELEYPDDLLRLCKWIYDRAHGALVGLIVYPAPEIDLDANQADLGWRVVSTANHNLPSTNLTSCEQSGCFYSKPQIRHRPEYPYLANDLRKEPGVRRAKCSKYYSRYGEQRLTGGIMCVWCTHSVCYGFHCIPKAEGRNDVFSAIVTRWVKAPRTVVYDFACALGPYCMTREPDFFADTLFVVDAFHAKGHTKCSPAAFLSTYANTDPRLTHINSSAAECGNGGLHRIRKSVSYMSQDRAIMYTKIFLSIWNQSRIRRLLRLDT